MSGNSAPGYPRIRIAIFFLMMCVVGTVSAVVLVDYGIPPGLAVFCSAVGSVVAVSEGNALSFRIRQFHWRRTRGYPFAEGDLVSVTEGMESGRTGCVRSHDQAKWHFEVRLEDSAGKTALLWLSADRLKKLDGTTKEERQDKDKAARGSPLNR